MWIGIGSGRHGGPKGKPHQLLNTGDEPLQLPAVLAATTARTDLPSRT